MWTGIHYYLTKDRKSIRKGGGQMYVDKKAHTQIHKHHTIFIGHTRTYESKARIARTQRYTCQERAFETGNHV